METLTQHLNIDSKYFLTIIEHLRANGGQARIVGGAVRDALVGIANSDVDIATDLEPQQVIDALVSHKIKVIPTGIRFGTVTAIIKGESFEITTLREDLSCNGRHAKVKYSHDFMQDAARRDFTINALSYCPTTHVIYDYFDGIKDLQAGRVVFIGDANARIAEDHLRILRFFRFSCRYAKMIDKNSLEACIGAKGSLNKLSRERIKSEMDALLNLQKSPSILSVMFEAGILQKIFPITNYDEQMHLRALKLADIFCIKPKLVLLYSLLFLQVHEVSINQLVNLKFSRVESKFIVKLLELKEFDDPELLATKLKNIWLEDASYLQYFIFASAIMTDNGFIQNLYNKLKARVRPAFPVNGKDLISLGYSGKKVGSLLELLKRKWLESDFSLGKTALINLVKNSEK